MKLYDYYRSTASYRVRIALALKNIHYTRIPIHLVNQGGEQHAPNYLAINPQGLVPTWIDNQPHHAPLAQSLAIIEYLDECFPNPPLLPKDPYEKALIRNYALLIACDIHPLNNLRVLNQLKKQFQANEEHIRDWYHHWLKTGFDAFEAKLNQYGQINPNFCYGNKITLADVCLIPQVYNAQRFEFSLKPYPRITAINEHCLQIEAVKQAAPHQEETT